MLLQQNNFLTSSRSQLSDCLHFARADRVQFFGQAQRRVCTVRFITIRWATSIPSSSATGPASPKSSRTLKCVSMALGERHLHCWTLIQRKQSYLACECAWKYSDVHIHKYVQEKACMGEVWKEICVWCIAIIICFHLRRVSSTHKGIEQNVTKPAYPCK